MSATTMLLLLGGSVGCAHVGEHWNHHWQRHSVVACIKEEHAGRYYHCPHCGQIIPREGFYKCPRCLSQAAFYGYQATCWRQFPEGWGCEPEMVVNHPEFWEQGLLQSDQSDAMLPQPVGADHELSEDANQIGVDGNPEGDLNDSELEPADGFDQGSVSTPAFDAVQTAPMQQPQREPATGTAQPLEADVTTAPAVAAANEPTLPLGDPPSTVKTKSNPADTISSLLADQTGKDETRSNSVPGHFKPAAALPKPVAARPELVTVMPEILKVTTQPVAALPEPIAVMPQPVAVMPQPVADMPEPVVITPEPVAVMPEPVKVMPEPIAVMPEPIAVMPELIAGQDPKAPLVRRDGIAAERDDFVVPFDALGPLPIRNVELSLSEISPPDVSTATVNGNLPVKPATQQIQTAQTHPEPKPVALPNNVYLGAAPRR